MKCSHRKQVHIYIHIHAHADTRFIRSIRSILRYFKGVRASLAEDGLFFLDAQGGQTICQSGYDYTFA